MRWVAVLLVVGCAKHAPPATVDAEVAIDAAPTTSDASAACAYEGEPGTCIATTDCAAIANHSAFAGLCPGPAAIQC